VLVVDSQQSETGPESWQAAESSRVSCIHTLATQRKHTSPAYSFQDRCVRGDRPMIGTHRASGHLSLVVHDN
jgi:hypothetical protein